MSLDIALLAEAYERDGCVLLPQVLDKQALSQALAAWEWSIENPGPLSSRAPKGSEDGMFYNDLLNPAATEAYRPMLEASPLPAIIAGIWGTPEVWFMYEQVFLKEGGLGRRTPWHQDTSYLAINGGDLAVAWITFDACSAEDSLEFVKGSHKGELYAASRFALEDETLEVPAHVGVLPRLPAIEKARQDYEIAVWPVEPGDVVLFHPSTLHGGAPTHPGTRRRTLTLRFFGRNARYDRRPGFKSPGPRDFHNRIGHGEPFRDPYFLKLRG